MPRITIAKKRKRAQGWPLEGDRVASAIQDLLNHQRNPRHEADCYISLARAVRGWCDDNPGKRELFWRWYEANKKRIAYRPGSTPPVATEFVAAIYKVLDHKLGNADGKSTYVPLARMAKAWFEADETQRDEFLGWFDRLMEATTAERGAGCPSLAHPSGGAERIDGASDA